VEILCKIYSVVKIIIPLIILSFLITNFIPHSSLSIGNSKVEHNQSINSSCNCVVFRIDDIQDFGFEQGQIKAMDLFISKNQDLSLGLIMHAIGNDSNVLTKVKEGYSKGLFELAVHGWDHIDYTKLGEKQQQKYYQMANDKIKKIFGNTSNIFIPPLDQYNNDTIKALNSLDYRILSSFGYMENIFDQSKSIFVADGKIYNNKTIYHIPGTLTFKGFVNGTWFKVPTEKIMDTISSNIKKYGYGVIVLHPQDFLKLDEKKNFTNIVDENEVMDLSRLMDLIHSKNISVVSFNDLVKKGTQSPIASKSIAKSESNLSEHEFPFNILKLLHLQ
jgi:peptidoglycan/xylan/chitin deacetylase (PgdA/CDA1 family)